MLTPNGFCYRNLDKFGKQYFADRLELVRVLHFRRFAYQLAVAGHHTLQELLQ